MAEQAEAAKEGEEDEGLLLQQAQSRAVPSKLSRYFDPEDKTALFRAEKLWDEEETAALIGRKSVPLVKLTRAQSAKRRDLIEKLGAGTLTEKEEVGNFQITRQLPRFSLDTDDASAWRRPGQSMVREYLHLTQSRSKALRVSKTVRHFPPLLAQQSAIRFYVDTRDGVARYNPYADVEAIFGSRKRSMEALLRRKKKRADPYKANAYLDQDDALAVSKRAREIRLTITQLGLTQAAVRGHRKAGDDDKRDMATSGDAWRAMRVQPTKITVDEIKKWKLLGEKDPRLEVAPSARRGHTMIKIDPVHALVFGGALGKGFQYSSQLFCFNLHTQKFEMMDVTGTRPCGRAFHSAICSDHTKMVIFGGLGKQGSLDDCFEYSIKDQQWGILFQKGAVRPTPRYGHTMTETNEAGMMLLYGGAGAGFFGDLFSLDARTGEWVKLAPDGTTPAPRAFHSAISLESAPNTKMVIFGGQNESANLHDLHEYHMAVSVGLVLIHELRPKRKLIFNAWLFPWQSNTWTFVRTHGMQPTPRWSHSVVKRGADSFILFGGAGERFFDQVLVYNSYKQSW
jgi:hypothetical protein